MKYLVIVVLILAAATAALAFEPGDPGTSGIDAGTPAQQVTAAPTDAQPVSAASVVAGSRSRICLGIVPPADLTAGELETQRQISQSVLAGKPCTINNTTVVVRRGVSLARLNRETESRKQADIQLQQAIGDAETRSNNYTDKKFSAALQSAADDAQLRANAAVTASTTYAYELWLQTWGSIAWLWVAVILLPIVCIVIYHYRHQIVARVARRRRESIIEIEDA